MYAIVFFILRFKKKYLFNRSDSVAWNLHKMTGAGIQCSAFVVKEKVRKYIQCYSGFRQGEVKIMFEN